MSGSVFFKKDRAQWCITWYWQGRKHNVSRYKGRLMQQTHPNQKRDQGYIDACRLLAQMQGDVENGVFRIEKYTGLAYTDVIPFFESWLVRKEKKKPGTIKGYKSFFRSWIRPFFENNPIQLHEIQLDTLDSLLDSIDLSPKGKYNVMMCFHAFMDYAWRSRRIGQVPPFPKKSDYGLVKPVIKWVTEDRQLNIINSIPEQHRPIFLFLKYHVRRPAEACSIYKIDFNRFNNSFLIRRSMSANKLVDSTKTGMVHEIPCHTAMIPTIKKLADLDNNSPFLFVNPGAVNPGQPYTNKSLNIIWKKACIVAGETIDLYSGLKHSTMSQLRNVHGLSLSDLQDVSDHANIESVRQYAKTELSTKRRLMETATGEKPKTLIRKVK